MFYINNLIHINSSLSFILISIFHWKTYQQKQKVIFYIQPCWLNKLTTVRFTLPMTKHNSLLAKELPRVRVWINFNPPDIIYFHLIKKSILSSSEKHWFISNFLWYTQTFSKKNNMYWYFLSFQHILFFAYHHFSFQNYSFFKDSKAEIFIALFAG